MKKIQEEYIKLLNDALKDKQDTINEILRINRDMVQETRDLIYEFRKYIEEKKTVEDLLKWIKVLL